VTDDTVRRIVFGQNADLLGANMALALVMVMGLTFGAAAPIGRMRLLFAGATALVITKSMMLAGSRGAITALSAGVLAFMLQGKNLRAFRRHVGVVLLVSAALTVVIYRSDAMVKRYQRTLETGSMSGREQILPEAWQMFIEKPVLGWGPIDNAYELGLRTAGSALGSKNADGMTKHAHMDTHNVPLDVLSGVGMVGGLPLAMCFVLCCLGAWNARASPRDMLPLSLVASVSAIAMAYSMSASKQLWIVLAYAAASGARDCTHGSRLHPMQTRDARQLCPGGRGIDPGRTLPARDGTARPRASARPCSTT
jgi:O-antigen ligase